jgi:hypothetical protein
MMTNEKERTPLFSQVRNPAPNKFLNANFNDIIALIFNYG